MAFSPVLSDFIEKNGTTLQNIALLAYLKNGEDAKPFLEKTTTAMVCMDLYKKFTSKDDMIDAARNETILNIAKYVKEHPRARPQEIQQKVESEIALFKAKIERLK